MQNRTILSRGWPALQTGHMRSIAAHSRRVHGRNDKAGLTVALIVRDIQHDAQVYEQATPAHRHLRKAPSSALSPSGRRMSPGPDSMNRWADILASLVTRPSQSRSRDPGTGYPGLPSPATPVA